MTDHELVALALAIATSAHEGQKDRQGLPYITHPSRVAERLEGADEQAVAYLHDVLEDTSLTAEDLLERGLPRNVVSCVTLLTRTPDIPDDLYYGLIRGNGLATRVKLADMADNLDPRRLLKLNAPTMVRLMQKYAYGLDALTGELR